MKNKLFLVVASLFALNVSQAANLTEMHNDAQVISRILLNRQLQNCVSDFQKDETTITSVKQELSTEANTYEISALILQGGDMVVGNSTIKVKESRVPAPFGFGYTTVYRCEFERNIIH